MTRPQRSAHQSPGIWRNGALEPHTYRQSQAQEAPATKTFFLAIIHLLVCLRAHRLPISRASEKIPSEAEEPTPPLTAHKEDREFFLSPLGTCRCRLLGREEWWSRPTGGGRRSDRSPEASKIVRRTSFAGNAGEEAGFYCGVPRRRKCKPKVRIRLPVHRLRPNLSCQVGSIDQWQSWRARPAGSRR